MNVKRWYYLKPILILLFLVTINDVCSQKKIQDSISSYSIRKDSNNDLINSKSSREKGYIGISPEVSFLIGRTSVGFNINIDAGYKISSVFGVEGLLLGGLHNVKEYDGTGPYRQHPLIVKESWKYRGLLVGPLFSIPFSEKTYWNVSPMVGHSVVFFPEYYSDNPVSTVAFDLNTNLFFHTGPRMALRVSADCFINDEILTVNFGLGLMYRFNK